MKTRKPRSTVIFKPDGAPEIPTVIPTSSPLDIVWVNFVGREEEPFRLEVPSHAAESEGDFFEIRFTIEHPAMDGETEFVSRAALVRSRAGTLLAVEPLPQFSLTLDDRHELHHAQILELFHVAIARRVGATGQMAFKHRLDRLPKPQNTFSPRLLDRLVDEILRYLRDPASTTKESIYERRVAAATLAESAKPFKKVAKDGGVAFHKAIRRIAACAARWYARTRQVFEIANADGSARLMVVAGYMYPKFGLIENESHSTSCSGSPSQRTKWMPPLGNE